MSARPRSRLIWRFYAAGLVQLFLAVAAATLIVATTSRWTRRANLEEVRARVEAHSRSRAELRTELTAFRQREGLQITVYDAAGRVLAASQPDRGEGQKPRGAPSTGLGPAVPFAPEPQAAPAPPPFGLPLPPNLAPGPPVSFTTVVLGDGQRGLLEVRFLPTPPSFLPSAAALLVGVLVVGLGALLSARFVGQPLARLSSAARAFGAGDLRARVESPARDELGEVLVTFNEMADRIQHLVAAEKELLANVAHELRTPLARIRVALEIAAEGDAATAKELIAGIAVDLMELETLIDDVLSAARFEAAAGSSGRAGFMLDRAIVSPASIIRDASERFRARHPERALTVSQESGVPLVEVDAMLLRRAVDNLLENAHKYSAERAQPIELRLVASGKGAVIEVQDQGVGIAAEDQAKVFSAFFRAERSRSRRSGGVGLGLTLAKRIVEAHGGDIRLESTPDVGTTVRIELPAVTEDDGAP